MSRNYYITGFAADALQWISASGLDQQDKEVLTRFVSRFPQIQFYRETNAFFRSREKEYEVALPAWLRTLRSTLSFVYAEEVTFRLSAYHGRTPRENYVGGLWYKFVLHGCMDDDDRHLLTSQSVFHIAHEAKQYRSFLCIKLHEQDCAVYEYKMEELWSYGAGKDISRSIHKVFSSYTTLLDHIIAIRLKDGTVITSAW